MYCSGSILVVASTAAVVIALTWGGITHPWSSKEVLLTIIVGDFGFFIFFEYERTYAKNPIVRIGDCLHRSDAQIID